MNNFFSLISEINLESRKVEYYICRMKTLKISDEAHKELKIFSANVEYNMEVIASNAILQYVRREATKSKMKSNKKIKV